MNERLLKLRTEELNISQEEFGTKLGVTRAAISRYESGARALSEAMILAICREFHVNYHWLVNGDGPIFTGTPENIIEEVAEEYDLDEDDKKMLIAYLSLSPEQRNAIKDYFKKVFI